MAKTPWARLSDTLAYLNTILGNTAMVHVQQLLPTRRTPACAALSDRISVGGWDPFASALRKNYRRAKRCYMLLLILLEQKDDAYVQAQLTAVDANYQGDGARKMRLDQLSQGVWDGYNRTVDCETLFVQQGQFTANPLNFMERFSVLPNHGVLKAVSEPYDLVTIDDTGADRRVFPMLLSPQRANEYTFKLNYAPRTKQHQGTPVYFLPWQSCRLVSMTLGNAANLFFTAAINGCSVFVEGPPATPTLYHAGINPPWDAMDNTVSQHVRTAKASDDDQAALVWRELFWDKSPTTARNAMTMGEVNKADYVNDDTNDGPNKTTARVLAFHTAIRAPWLAAGFDILSCSPWGCVFGIRNTGTGNWAFYLQENATVVFMHAGAGYGTARPLRLTRFYPTPAAVRVCPNANRLPVIGDVSVLAM